MNDNFPNAWKIMKFSEWNFWIFLISVGIEGWFNLIMNADRLKAGRSCLKLPIHPFIDRLTEQIRTEKITGIPRERRNIFFFQTNNPHIPNIDAISGALIKLRSQYDSYCMSILKLNVKRGQICQHYLVRIFLMILDHLIQNDSSNKS